MAVGRTVNTEHVEKATGTVMAFFESLSRDAWIGIAFAVLGIIVSVILFVLAKQKKALHWCYHGTLLLGTANSELPEGITVMYKGQSIPRLTRTRVWIWNPTDKTIHDADLEPSDPLRINFDSDGQILAATVLTSHRPVTNFRAVPHPISAIDVPISFKFLDRHDGAVIEVLHTGIDIKPSLLGTVRGIPKGAKYRGTVTKSLAESASHSRKKRRLLRCARALVLLITFGLGVAMIAMSFFGLEGPRASITDVSLQLLIAGAGYIVMASFMAYRDWWRRFPKSLQPNR